MAESSYIFTPGSSRRIIDRDKRLQALKDFKTDFKKYVKEQRERLDTERAFLEMVLKKQGLGFVTRRSSLEAKVKAMAYVQQYSLGDFLNDATKVVGDFAPLTEPNLGTILD